MSYQDDYICKKHGCNYRFSNPYGWGESYCPRCQEEDYYYSLEAEAMYYASFALCQQCRNFDGEYHCNKYPTMNEIMFGRKKKCKYFDEMKPEDYYYGEDDW
jgi:hypothetical protein